MKATTAKTVAGAVTEAAAKTEVQSPIRARSPLRIGNAVLIRTVTHYHVGLVEVLTDTEIVLGGASWVADTGRFHTALKTGVLDEIEPFPDGVVSIGRGAVVDAANWKHPLPVDQK